MTPNKLVQWKSINRYLLDGNTVSQIPKYVYINCHHYPISLLIWRNENPKIGFSTPLKLSQAITIKQLDFGHNRFTEYTNSMLFFTKLHLHIQGAKSVANLNK